VPFDVQEDADGAGTIVLRTEALSVQIARNPCRIAFVDGQGQRFCADEAGMLYRTTPLDDGSVAVHSGDTPRSVVACTKYIEEGEHFFGTGERTGQLDKRGWQMHNWTNDPIPGHGPATDPLYIAIPIMQVARPGLAYGVFFNNTWRSYFDAGYQRADVWSMGAEGGELDYYVIYGPTPAEVSAGIAALLGTMPLPPQWALGYHQSRWGYYDETVVRALAAEFRSRDIPCDVIHFDIDYMDNYRVFTWNSERFPDPARLLADLRREGFRVVTIIDPGVKSDPNYGIYQQGLEHDMFIRRADGEVFRGYVWPDESVFADYTRPEVRAWWGNLHQPLVEAGVSGIWNDMNEPTVFKQPFSEGVSEWDTIALDAVQGSEGEQTTHAAVHNLYGHGMAQACYEGLRRLMGDERPFVLSRSGFAGSQRWCAFWMGDNHSWWEHLEMALPQMMNMGLSGVPFVGTDIGGFFGNTSGELLARWMQVGMLSPLCRNHAAVFTRQQEPWVFGSDIEAICREYIQLRYRLLPYLYTLFWEAAQQGTPVLRPLFYHFPDDAHTYRIHDQALLGAALLAAPIYQPGRDYRSVYLPAGTWYDWWNDRQVHGPAHLLAYAPLERLPLYVRAGAIIPSGSNLRYSDEHPLNPLMLDIYPGTGEFTLYEDDGHTCAYERGVFCTTHFRQHYEVAVQEDGEEHTVLQLDIGERTGDYTPPERTLIIRVHAVSDKTVVRGGISLPLYTHYDPVEELHALPLLTIHFADDGQAHTLYFDTR
jgi:alpha-glucosidase